jgi:Protein of unknown function (DUF692)
MYRVEGSKEIIKNRRGFALLAPRLERTRAGSMASPVTNAGPNSAPPNLVARGGRNGNKRVINVTFKTRPRTKAWARFPAHVSLGSRANLKGDQHEVQNSFRHQPCCRRYSACDERRIGHPRLRQKSRKILEGKPRVDWFEVISENFMVPGGQPLAVLERIRYDYPIVMHGVSISIASTAPLDRDYLAALKALAERFQPEWISDHLCWTRVHGVNLHDLLPIPYTAEALDHVSGRIPDPAGPGFSRTPHSNRKRVELCDFRRVRDG